MKKKENDYESIYTQLMDYQSKLHEQNLKRIRIGLKCVIFIPLLFMFLLFLTDSNKVIFLILWIASLFMISIYLIIVEYSDYNLQNKMNALTNSDAEAVPLLSADLENMEKKVRKTRDRISQALNAEDIPDNTDDAAATEAEKIREKET